MFYSLTGPVIYTDAEIAVINCGGVGFECRTTVNTLRRISGGKGTVTLFTYLVVRDDALTIYGFADKNELDCFKMLIGVSGVGPKAAISILSQLGVDQLALCVATGDSKSIQRAPNVGAKIAQRVVLELKDKLQMFEQMGEDVSYANVELDDGLGDDRAQAVSALVALGYGQSEAGMAVGKAIQEKGELGVEELIREGLKRLARQV